MAKKVFIFFRFWAVPSKVGQTLRFTPDNTEDADILGPQSNVNLSELTLLNDGGVNVYRLT